MKYILAIFCLVGVVMAIDPYTDQGTDTVLYNRTNKNVRPNGANQIFNNLGATNLTIESNIVVGETVTIGRTNDPTAGAIDIGTTNFVLIVRLTINTNGDFVMSDGTNTMMVLKKSSGTDGSTNKFLAADGHFYVIGDTIWTNNGSNVQLLGTTNVSIAPDGTIANHGGVGSFLSYAADESSVSVLDFQSLIINVLGSSRTFFTPNTTDGSGSYSFDTAIEHTSGDMATFSNHGADIFKIDFAGVVFLKDGSMKAVTFGTNDSAGSGFKLLRIAN